MARGTQTIHAGGWVGTRVEGLDSLVERLKAVDPLLVAEIKKVNKEAAERLKERASRTALGEGGVAAHTVKMGGLGITYGEKSAGVVLQGAKDGATPFALGAEFGSHQTIHTRQFKPYVGTRGYFLFPTLRAEAEWILEPYQHAVDDVIRKAGLG